MRLKAIALLVPLLLLSSLAVAQGKSAEHKPAKAGGASGAPDKALMQKISDAWSTMKPENIAKYYDQSPNDVFFDIAPLKYTGFSQYMAGAQKEFANLKSIKFVVNNDAAVHTSGNMAYGTATVKTTMTDKAGRATNIDCRWSVVWEKKGDNWPIVHEHFSAPMPEPK